MSPLLIELREKALGLPAGERQHLVADLIESLSDAGLTEIDEAWMKEIEKRDREIQEGTVKPISHEQLFKELHQVECPIAVDARGTSLYRHGACGRRRHRSMV